jgi:hypothetical protein
MVFVPLLIIRNHIIRAPDNSVGLTGVEGEVVADEAVDLDCLIASLLDCLSGVLSRY